MLVTTVAPGPHSEDCFLAGARREIYPSSPEWSTPTGCELTAKGIKVETDMLIHDKRALVPLSLEESALVPKERIVPSRMVMVEKFDDDGNRFVKACLTARGDQDPELSSLVRNQQTSAPTVSTNGKVVTLQVIASLGADVELGDFPHWSMFGISGIESARWQTFPSSAIWQSSRCSPSTTPGNTFTVVWIE